MVYPPEDEIDPDLTTATRVSDAEVSLETGQSTTSDEDGYFQFRVEAGEYLVSAEADGSLRGEVTCSVKEDDLDNQSEPCYLRVSSHTDVTPDGGLDTDAETDSDEEIETDTGTSHDIDTVDTEPDEDIDSETDPGTTPDSDDDDSSDGDHPQHDSGLYAKEKSNACGCTHVGVSDSSANAIVLLFLAIIVLGRRAR